MGTSVDIATRVRSYFTAAEKRARISEMLAAAERVEAIECAHALEAEVRELRLIAAHAPPYNRRSKFPERVRLAQAHRRGRTRGCRWCAQLAADGAAYLGPFGSRRAAELAAAGVHDALPLRQCTHKLSVRTHHAGLRAGRAGPVPGALRAPDHARGVRRAAPPSRSARPPPATRGPVVERAARAASSVLADAQRYEDAAAVRARLAALLRAAVRMQRLAALTGIAELVAARPAADGRLGAGDGPARPAGRGRRVAAAACTRGRTHRRAAGHRRDGAARARARCRRATAEETERILAWLERPETRLVRGVAPAGRHPARGAAPVPRPAARRRSPPASADARLDPNAHEQLTDRTTVCST